MTHALFPIIERELRVHARRPYYYWLRIAGAAAVLGVLLAVGAPFSIGSGVWVFQTLQNIIYLLVWVIVTLMAADTISREKREGTLGLLFLTSLSPATIVLGKFLTQAMAAGSLLLATIPVLIVPLLLGGVSGQDVLQAVIINLAAFLLALAAGMLSSAVSRQANRTFILAFIFSLVFAVGVRLLEVAGYLIWQIQAGGPFRNYSFASDLRSLFFYSLFRELPAAAPPWNIAIPAAITGLACLVLFLSLLAAGWSIKIFWQERAPTKIMAWVNGIFCKPLLARSYLRKRMAMLLDRNPIAWLQQYSWNARLTKWGWCFSLLLLLTTVAVGDIYSVIRLQHVFLYALALGAAYTSVISFRKERQSGALELLLVAPLRETDLIFGRLRGIWGQFFPSVLLLFFVWYVLFGKDFGLPHSRYYEVFLSFPIRLLAVWIFLPSIGAYFSFLHINIFFSWLLTIFLGLVMPHLCGSALLVLFQDRLAVLFFSGEYLARTLIIVALQGIIAGGMVLLALRHLHQRKFVIH